MLKISGHDADFHAVIAPKFFRRVFEFGLHGSDYDQEMAMPCELLRKVKSDAAGCSGL